MRILFIEAPSGFGGSLTGLLHLIQHLPEEIEPILATSFDPRPYLDLPMGLMHRQIDAGPKTPRRGGAVRGAWRYYREEVRPWRQAIERLVEQYQPDLIHANNALVVNWGVGQAAHRLGVPAISHQKGFEYPGRLTRWLVGQNGFTHHIATSGAIANHLVELGLPASRITTVYEPVVGPADLPRREYDKRSRPILAMHSVLGKWKGQHVVIRAAAEALRRGRADFELLIAGTAPAGEVDYLRDLTALVAELGLQDRVRFAGHRRDVYQFLAGVDAAVHASIAPEPFGRVAAEAMLCGLPTIVTTDGGPAEYVEDGVTGLHVPCNDVAAMSRALEQLALSADLRRRLGTAAREFAVAAFDPQELTNQVVAVYHRLLPRATARRSPVGTIG